MPYPLAVTFHLEAGAKGFKRILVSPIFRRRVLLLGRGHEILPLAVFAKGGYQVLVTGPTGLVSHESHVGMDIAERALVGQAGVRGVRRFGGSQVFRCGLPGPEQVTGKGADHQQQNQAQGQVSERGTPKTLKVAAVHGRKPFAGKARGSRSQFGPAKAKKQAGF
jgi:hypothetical protein